MAESGSSTCRHRSWLRFGLRSLLVTMTLVAVWLAVVSNRARIQRNAVEEVKRLRGDVGFDYVFDANMNWRRDPKLPALAWLIDLVGKDCARTVWIVNFDEGSAPRNDDLRVVERFKTLKQLTLMNQKQITDDGLRYVAGLAELEVLAINGTNVTGPGLSHLRNCRSLKGLAMNDAPMTDTGLAQIAHLDSLEWLQLSGTRVTNGGLQHLSGLTALKSLELRDTEITDEGLKYLVPLSSLKTLRLRGTNTSQAGRSWLQSELPNCKISG